LTNDRTLLFLFSQILIHDSYGTHAGNTPLLAEAIREEFVSMYTSKNVLEDFRDQLLRTLPEGVELNDLPPLGSLDLQKVLKSPYFFS